MSKFSWTPIRILLGLSLLVVTGPALQGQRVTTPMAQLGHNIGDDYWLATYTELTEYWQVLAEESRRMVLDTIGYTAEGRPHLMAILTSPANQRISPSTRGTHSAWPWRTTSATTKRASCRRPPRPSCGSTGGSTPPRSSGQRSSWRWRIKW